ncbi:hypothetical protein [Legionella hackeliae]|uniref:Uncharacterized protein n=1 Tax=Legionella hackeliae TaxID=449 RepID=A0A0A8URF6_LEGHA|nr:hypothetical protein [Legionella hackeliae]KTD13519.1 hypothetical protein Lhac_0903 [Legionella hackeliae]CEK09364.1 protein of unknown function [Legionella hackeliae]STX49272.1 Uncharacterised protein [Legionella hackeliae]
MKKSKEAPEGKSLIDKKLPEYPKTPHDLTNTDIQAMGLRYMEKVKKMEGKNFVRKFFSSYKNQAAAQQLINYRNQSQPHEKWEFLADLYPELKYPDDKLAIEIIALFKTVFKRDILLKVKCPEKHSAYLSMQNVSDSLKGISSQHFLKHYVELYNASNNSHQTRDSTPSNQESPLFTYP